MSIQSDVQARADGYPPSMRRVADAITAHPRVLLEKTISELARACDTSETTIVRFARTLGFTGFAPMKLAMAAELAAEQTQLGEDGVYGSDILASDSLADAVAKISASELFGIRETALRLDLDELQRVIDAVAAARRVLLFGVSASSAPAQDLGAKLLRIGRDAVPFEDAHNAIPIAALLGPGDVAIAFSHSGRTAETVRFLEVAAAGGATTVAITNVPDAPVSVPAIHTLRTSVRETTFRAGAMASRLAQMTIVDYVFVGVARTDASASVEALRRTKESLDGLRGGR